MRVECVAARSLGIKIRQPARRVLVRVVPARPHYSARPVTPPLLVSPRQTAPCITAPPGDDWSGRGGEGAAAPVADGGGSHLRSCTSEASENGQSALLLLLNKVKVNH